MISSPTTSPLIDLFYNVIQIIYWPGWCRHRWLAASKASPTSPRPLLTFHHWEVKSSFNSLWTCFGAKRMENVNFGTCFQGAVGVSPASNFQRLPWKSSKWHSPQPVTTQVEIELWISPKRGRHFSLFLIRFDKETKNSPRISSFVN